MLENTLPTAACITRHPQNPVLSKKDIPYHADLIFNAGVCKYQGRYVMVFRNDFMTPGYDPTSRDFQYKDFGGTNLGLAYSDDGVNWEVQPEPFYTMDMNDDPDITSVYDPRLTVLDGELFMCFACNTNHGLRGGIARCNDLKEFEIISLSVPDNRNMVLFPEKIGGRYCRLERPMPVYSRGKDRFDTWLSYSPDMVYWGDSHLILPVEALAWCNDKTGPAAPPVRTPQGWLTTFHGVDINQDRGKNGWEKFWKKRYCGGIMLLDLEDPTKVLGYYQEPLLAPTAPYEIEGGFRNDVIFPGGMILEDSGEVKIYYGSADTVECLATADVGDLIKLCLE